MQPSRSSRLARDAVAVWRCCSLIRCCLLVARAPEPRRDRRRRTPRYTGIDVVQVTGFIDPPNASLIRDSIHSAEHRHSAALIFQMDSAGVTDAGDRRVVRGERATARPRGGLGGTGRFRSRGGAALIAESAVVVVVGEQRAHRPDSNRCRRRRRHAAYSDAYLPRSRTCRPRRLPPCAPPTSGRHRQAPRRGRRRRSGDRRPRRVARRQGAPDHGRPRRLSTAEVTTAAGPTP